MYPFSAMFPLQPKATDMFLENLCAFYCHFHEYWLTQPVSVSLDLFFFFLLGLWSNNSTYIVRGPLRYVEKSALFKALVQRTENMPKRNKYSHLFSTYFKTSFFFKLAWKMPTSGTGHHHIMEEAYHVWSWLHWIKIILTACMGTGVATHCGCTSICLHIGAHKQVCDL